MTDDNDDAADGEDDASRSVTSFAVNFSKAHGSVGRNGVYLLFITVWFQRSVEHVLKEKNDEETSYDTILK